MDDRNIPNDLPRHKVGDDVPRTNEIVAEMSETEWVRERLLPLLRRAGFSRIEVTHGPAEKGRDVVFAEYNRFGLLRYYGAQVKVQPISANEGGQSFRELVSQLNNAWEYPYTDPATGTTHKMSGVYLISRQSITPEARDRLCHKTGQWLHYVDGEQLAAAVSRTRFVSEEERASRLLVAKMDLMFIESQCMPQVDRMLSAEKRWTGPNELTMNVELPTVRFGSLGIERFLEAVISELELVDSVCIRYLTYQLEEMDVVLRNLRYGSIHEGEHGPHRRVFDAIRQARDALGRRVAEVKRIMEHIETSERPAPGMTLPAVTDLGTEVYNDSVAGGTDSPTA